MARKTKVQKSQNAKKSCGKELPYSFYESQKRGTKPDKDKNGNIIPR